MYLPHTVVDNVLAAEEQALAARLGGKESGPGGSGGVSAATWTAHLSSSLHPALTLYVLNLEPPGGADYLYTYREEAAAVRGGNWWVWGRDGGACTQVCGVDVGPGALYAGVWCLRWARVGNCTRTGRRQRQCGEATDGCGVGPVRRCAVLTLGPGG